MVEDKAVTPNKTNRHCLTPLTLNLILNTEINITMKKIIAIILFSFAASLTVTSCTEEEITPSEYNGGGQGSDPKP